MEGKVDEMLTVADVMTNPVLVVRRDTPLKDVARLLIDNGVSGAPVVDADGRVLGVVSEADFLVKEQGAEEIHHRRLARVVGESTETRHQLDKVEARDAGGAMTAPAVTIAPTRPIREAAALMTSRRVNRLPVLDDGRLVGIVTRADLVRAYLRTDAELLEAIRHDVLLRILWLDPEGFDTSVVNGEASISGHVERRSTAEIIEETVQMVPGIVAVHADLSWSLDDRDLKPADRDPVFPYGMR
jgi:CBS domain-containing protein